MMKHSIAFFTVVYPGIEDYFTDFAQSLCTQTMKTFDLVIFNESDTKIDFDLLLPNINYRVVPTEPATPIVIRERGFSYLRQEGYSYIVFGDADDWFSENRVAVSMKYLEHCDLVINDVDIVTAEKTLIEHYFSHRIENRRELSEEMVRYGNFMGLSAAAIRLDSLPEFKTPKGVIALDWYMFVLMLLNKAKGIFTNETLTYYRQYDSNLVGMKAMTKERLKHEIAVKQGHYSALKEMRDQYAVLDKRFASLKKKCEDNLILQDYYSKINHKINFPFWWEKTGNGQYDINKNT